MFLQTINKFVFTLKSKSYFLLTHTRVGRASMRANSCVANFSLSLAMLNELVFAA